MAGSLHGCSLLTRRVRDILVVVGARSSAGLHLSSSPSTSHCLLLPYPLSFRCAARHYTLHWTSLGQACFLNAAASAHPFYPSTSLAARSSLPPRPPPTSLCAWFSTSPVTLKTWPKVDGGPPDTKWKEEKSTVITLIDAQDKVSSVSLDQAEKLAKRRDLKLVKIEDPSMKKGSKVYRLMTGKQYFEEHIKAQKSEKKPRLGTKDEKTLTIGGKITPHDLTVKLKGVTKWLSKGHQVKVTISSKKASKEEVESVFTTIEEEAKRVKGRILQRHEKIDDVRFYIAPPKDTAKSETNSETMEGGDHVHSEESSDHTK